MSPFCTRIRKQKRRQITPSEWHVAKLHLKSIKTNAKLDTETRKALELLRDLTFPSGYTIQFILRSTGSELGEADVQSVQVSSVQARVAPGVVQQASIVSPGRIHPHSDEDRMRGKLNTGKAKKEVTWGLDKAANASVCPNSLPKCRRMLTCPGEQYEINVSVLSSSPETVWKLTQGVTLTTHEWSGKMSAGLPVLGPGVVSRTANLMNVEV